ncbi:hypothetical protein HMPREF1544_10936 [Mucor circinelloides 1006PhL]|uniref:Uncharacterized protein n=1 Tax=Mucor circinelloides f. circinelloides (strain 1006PhL) TaxID=1220926 RepID=S2IX75_MUCC1|nr:hypothetical protein HMPREF1544_10936 [Mucor circinelloides 1006PhL]
MAYSAQHVYTDSRSFIKAAANRAGLAATIVTRRNIALTMICPDSTIEDEQVYLELYLENNNIAIALVMKDEDGIFDTLANERVNYTTSGLDVIAMLSSTLDELMQNAQVSANTVIRQVIIASYKPLTVSHHRAVQHIQTFLKSHLGNKDLVFCGDQTSQDDGRVLPFEHRVAYGAATYSRSIAQEQLWNDQHMCCVELSPVHYGIAVAGGLMHPIIRLHSIEDGPKSAVFTTISPQQKQGLIEIAVYRGLRLQTTSNTHVGSVYLDNDGSLSQLNMTIQVDHSKDELTLTVQDLLTGQTIATSTFVNDLQTIASELEEFERNWSPQQSDLNRFLDQQLKDNVDSAISRYVSTATDTLQERLFKKIRYTLLPRLRQQQMNLLLIQSKSMLTPLQ